MIEKRVFRNFRSGIMRNFRLLNMENQAKYGEVFEKSRG